MQTLSAPGVYVFEDQSTPMPLSGVPTGVPCFFGFTHQGESLKPRRIKSLNEFYAVFGGRPKNKAVFPHAYITDSVYAFFLNGGSECYVCRVNSGDAAFWSIASIENVVDYERLLDPFDESSPDDLKPATIALRVDAISGGTWANKLRLRASKTAARSAFPLTPVPVTLALPSAADFVNVGRGRLKPISQAPIPSATGLSKGAKLTLGEEVGEWTSGVDGEGAFVFKDGQTKAGSGTIEAQNAKGDTVLIPVSYLPDTSVKASVLTNTDTGKPFGAEEIAGWNSKTRVQFENVDTPAGKKTLSGAWDPDPEVQAFFFSDPDGVGFVVTDGTVLGSMPAGELQAPLHLQSDAFRLTFDLEIVEPVPPRNPGDATSFKVLEAYQGLSTDPGDPSYFLKEDVVNGISNRVRLSKFVDQGKAVAFSDTPVEGAEPVSPKAPGGATVLNAGSDQVPASTEYTKYFPLLKGVPDVSLIACPDAYLDGNSTPASTYQPIYQAAIDYAFNNRCMAVIDPPPMAEAKELGDLNKRATALATFADRFRSTHAAIYAPWFRSPNLDASSDEKTVYVPPSGHILGAYNRSDNMVGVWKSPANIPVLGPVGMQLDFTEDESESLNPAGVNLIRSFPGQGMLIWGARTSTKNVMWRYVNVRRLFLYVERTLKQQTMWAVFESNDQATWNKLVNAAEGFLRQLWRDGGLMGSTPDEAFRVQCGVPQTMTMTDVYNGLLKVEIAIAPVRPAEFVVFTVSQLVQTQST
ncbi:phage tail sheath family protein [Engelhardtia mirabilis]|uniref:Phage tail sheath protein n=1 Tax=Engelhardtia mirabilis TaxID=2528011 RepID=A0A518BPN9_9BACT|nr:Phage tail sheath protein [Planctomycetes bacterium Pla133]QDV03266.1 Phage tail sheath protein [Planctomycetes bacterium Pla86]